MTADDEQMDRVKRLILNPMTEFYDPPRRASNGPEHMRALLNRYVESLGGYSERTLLDAWERVQSQHQYWTWPLPAAFIAAIRENGDCF